ncbi:MAG: PAS domain-containing sensor histidine kinase [Gammaproteobacteria bacterium]|nr:PAS domain-containing sensor histidine kinase [Gammaproteobacteria bacterium]
MDINNEKELERLQKKVALLEEEKTELVSRVRQLSEQERDKINLIKTLFEHLPYGVVMFDDGRRVIQINQAAAEMFGMEKRQLIGKSCTELFDCYGDAQLCKVIEHKQSLSQVRTSCPSSERVLLRSAVLNQLDGSSVVVESIVDITALEHASFEKNLALQTKSNFLANISHELRTPMHGILGSSDLLMLEKDKLSPSQAAYVEMLDGSAKRLWSLIDKLFEASSLEDNSIQLHESVFKLSLFIKQLEADFRLTLSNQNDAVFDCHQADYAIKADSLRLQQIIKGLLENASKYMEKGLIECSADVIESAGKSYLTVTVKDNGIGISKAHQQRIFNLFEQEQGSSARAYQGAGLGLAIARQLAVLMGGDIGLQSEPGKGSVFSLSVPVVVMPA